MVLTGFSVCLRCMAPLDGRASCRSCGWSDDGLYDVQYAKPGSSLAGRYLLGEYTRRNGEGALYAGYDTVEQKKVWIREYFPQTIAQRALDSGRVSPLAGCGAQYKALMSDFVDLCNEIRRLALTEPVVPLENVLSENNTVYAIYKGLELIPLEKWLEKQGGRLPLRAAAGLLLPVCNALSAFHAQGQIHRGVSPHTVYIGQDGRALLWDFALSATRTAGSELNCELFSGYSAPEQYSPSGWQGNWTDIYAAAALFYRVLTGIVPPKSTRLDAGDRLAPLSEQLPELPRGAALALENALQPDTQERTQAMQTFVGGLMDTRKSATTVFDTPPRRTAGDGGSGGQPGRRAAPAARQRRERGGEGSARGVILGMLVMLLVLGGLIWYLVNEVIPPMIRPINSSSGSSLPQSGSQSGPQTSSQSGGGEEPGSAAVSGASSSQAVTTLMPDFFGERAADILANPAYDSRFEFEIEEVFDDEYDAGIVVDQSPLDGADLPSSGRVPVILTVSKGPMVHEMINVVGLPLADAILALEVLDGVTIDQIERYDSTARPGDVVATYPEAGAEFDPGRQDVILFYQPEPLVADASSRPSGPSGTQLPGR